jgi:Na+(H+)/acetate symporter ActP
MGIAGIIVGILGLAAALIAILLAGWIGGAVAIVLGIGAIVLGFFARKKNGKGGVGAIVIGVIAALIAAIMIPSTATMMKTVKDNALKKMDNFPIVSKYAEQADTNTGLYGFIASMATKVTEEDKVAFEEEAKNLAELLKEEEAAKATAAPKAD